MDSRNQYTIVQSKWISRLKKHMR